MLARLLGFSGAVVVLAMQIAKRADVDTIVVSAKLTAVKRLPGVGGAGAVVGWLRPCACAAAAHIALMV
jgi:acyl CoA:acetate/3-ketoacid CoA transferase beta subunit